MSGIVMGTIAVASAAAGMYSANKQAKAQKAAADRQAEASKQALNQQKTAFNRENQQQADLGGILEGSGAASESGSTLLTSPTGTDRDQFKLGKGTSLLGG